MKKLPVTAGTIARWLAVAAFLVAPSFIRYELTSTATLACTRDDKFAGTCHGEPTLRQHLVSVWPDDSWHVYGDEAPRLWFMPAMRLDDIGMAVPSGGDHYLHLRGSSSCYGKTIPMGAACDFAYASIDIPLDDSYSPSDERTLAVQFNVFLRSETAKSFRIRQPGPFRPEFALFYVVAGFIAFFTAKRSLALRTAAWVKAAEAIPATPVTAYRGIV